MRFVEIKYKEYTFPFSKSIQNSNQIINQKNVIIVKAKDEKGIYHYGEISPLIGFSKENLDDCKIELEKIINQEHYKNKIELFKKYISEINEYPSLRFGLEQLVLSSELNDNLESVKNKKLIKSNALVGINNAELTLNEVRQLFKEGYDTIKLKIGRMEFQEDLDIIKLIHSEFGANLKLRLDNNGSWSLEEAIKNIDMLSGYNIEYIEQPVGGKEELLELCEFVDINIAPDECITNYQDAEDFVLSNKIKFIVLKPSIRLGVFESIRLIELCNKLGINIIITSAFETIIGRLSLIYLASLTNHDYSHGLNTSLLGSDYFKSSVELNIPQIDVSKLNFHPQLQEEI